MRRPIIFGAFFVCGLIAGRFWADLCAPAVAGQVDCKPGDVTGDGSVNISDPIHLLQYLFLGGLEPVACKPPPPPVSVVVVVRHAERDNSGADPCLNAAGRERAERLAQVLRHAKIHHLISSTFCRTRETLEPLLAARKGLEIEQIEAPAEVVKKIGGFARGELTVVAHHSFSIDDILIGFGIPRETVRAINISGDSYDNFLVVLLPAGGEAQLVHLAY
jgi:hypothetical protein